MKTIKLKLNVDLKKHKAGHIIEVALNSSGDIYDRFWRNRLRDSKSLGKYSDNCVEVVKAANAEAEVKVKLNKQVKNDSNITTTS